MWKNKGEPKTCGVKMADGSPCVLDPGHDSEKSWKTREHKTADGAAFTWKDGQCVEQDRLINRLSWDI